MIRKSQFEDLDAVYAFICKLEDAQLDFETFRSIFEQNITNPDFFYFVAINNDKIIGFISCHTQYLLHHCGKVGEIQELYIDPDFRNRGFGRLLISEIINIARFCNFESLEVTSNKKRIENATIYEQYGFQLTHNKFTIQF